MSNHLVDQVCKYFVKRKTTEGLYTCRPAGTWSAVVNTLPYTYCPTNAKIQCEEGLDARSKIGVTNAVHKRKGTLNAKNFTHPRRLVDPFLDSFNIICYYFHNKNCSRAQLESFRSAIALLFRRNLLLQKPF